MIKKKFYKIILFWIFLTSNLSAENLVYYIDFEFILNNSNIGKTILVDLNNIKDINSKKLKSIQEKISEKENLIKSKKNILSEDEIKKSLDNLKNEIDNYNFTKNTMINEFEKVRNNKLSNFLSTISPEIQEYMKINSIDILLDKKNIFMGSQDRDITNKIIKLIDQKLN